MLSLTKWYLDLVTPEGTALIAYAASLEWGALHVEFASTLLARPGASAREENAWSAVRLPEQDADGVSFRHDGLGLVGRWRACVPPVGATLLENEAGRVQWDCLVPSAAATVRLPDETLEGRGYVERLSMTVPPWSLPLRTLRWGRYASASHALVWISWDGGPPRRWAWLDGIAQADPVIGDGGVSGLDGGRALELKPGRELCDRRALQVLSRHLPALETLPMGPIRDLRETKRVDRGTLRRRGAPEDEGWAIHEVVTW
jgi:hypothetical protein